MKEIKAIIRPFKLLEVIEVMQEIENLPGVTISEIKGFGKSKPSNLDLISFTKIEVVMNDEMADKVVNTIQQTAHTGNPGDGKIFIVNVEEVVKIRTNERGEEAI
jgi:nitrogen regulatory protein P-II 1